MTPNLFPNLERRQFFKDETMWHEDTSWERLRFSDGITLLACNLALFCGRSRGYAP